MRRLVYLIPSLHHTNCVQTAFKLRLNFKYRAVQLSFLRDSLPNCCSFGLFPFPLRNSSTVPAASCTHIAGVVSAAVSFLCTPSACVRLQAAEDSVRAGTAAGSLAIRQWYPLLRPPLHPACLRLPLTSNARLTMAQSRVGSAAALSLVGRVVGEV